MALIDIYNARVDATFLARVETAVCKTAYAVLYEDAATPNHADRLRLAKKVLYGLDGGHNVRVFMHEVLANADVAYAIETQPTRQEAVLDSTIQYVTDVRFDAVAPGKE